MEELVEEQSAVVAHAAATLQVAQEALAAAERDEKNARTGVLMARDLYREEQTPEAHAALERAEQSARHYENLAKFKRVDLERAEAVLYEANKALAARELEVLTDELHSERNRFGEILESLRITYRELLQLIAGLTDLAAQDAHRVIKLHKVAERAGVEFDERPLDLRVMRAAVRLRLMPASPRPEQVVPPGSLITRYLARIQGKHTYHQIDEQLDLLRDELAEATRPTVLDWLQPAPRTPQMGSTFGTLEPSARALLSTYGGARG